MRTMHAEQAEIAVLGSVFFNNEHVDTINQQLTVDDFFSPRNKVIFQSFKAMKEQGIAIDEVTLGEYLKQKNMMEKVGVHYIIDLAQGCPISDNVNHYIEIIKQTTGKRDTMNYVSEFSRNVVNANHGELLHIIPDLQSKLESVVTSASKPPEYKKFSSVVTDYFQSAANEDFNPIKSGYHELDGITEGLVYGVLDVVGARPRVGKTSFAINMMYKYGVEQGVPTALISLEMPDKQISERMISVMSQIPTKKIKKLLTDKNYGTEKDYNTLTEVTKKINEAPLFIDSESSRINEICNAIVELNRVHGVKFVIIDYLQKIRGSRKSSNDTRDTELSDTARDLQETAKKLDINITALAQVGRASEHNRDKRPRLENLRESGSLEAEAARVMLLYRDELNRLDSKQKGLCEIIVAKNRFGMTGTAMLKYDAECTRFDNNPIPSF